MGKLSILNSKYFRPFDGTDNPCCWQVDRISDDIDDILWESGIDFDSLPGDWGTSYGWVRDGQIEHCMEITCVDTDTVKFEVDYWATKKVWLGLKRVPMVNTPDFDLLLPKLNKLNQSAQQDVTPSR